MSFANSRRRARGAARAAILLCIGALAGCGPIPGTGSASVAPEVKSGIEAYARGDAAGAHKHLESALSGETGDLSMFRQVIEAAYLSHAWADVIQYSDRALALKGSSTPSARAAILRLKSEALMNAGRPEDAIAAQEQAFNLEHDTAEAMNALAYTYARAPVGYPVDFTRALKLANDAIAKARADDAPDDAVGGVIDTLGWVYYRKGDLAPALSVLQRAADLAPGQPVVHAHLALVYRGLGRMTDGQTEMQRALAIDPKDPEVLKLSQDFAAPAIAPSPQQPAPAAPAKPSLLPSAESIGPAPAKH